MNAAARVHGGPDTQGVPRLDFSTNANACGPCPAALAAVRAADATRYPDAGYGALRDALARLHGVEVERVVLAASASEFIFRITAWVSHQGARTVHLPLHAYGDYADAARAWDLRRVPAPDDAALVWACEPSSPLGQAHAPWPSDWERTVVLDRAYEPLRLSGMTGAGAAQLQRLWQLFSPNKALGLTGVRGAYAIAPQGAHHAARALDRLAPSWVLGAHGVALLQAWTGDEAQRWVLVSLAELRRWKARLMDGLATAGWTCLPSEANFFCARPPAPVDGAALCRQLRAQGIKLRDAGSFGLPGHVRLGVLPPQDQDGLLRALKVAMPAATCH